ncbi:tetratricopeptide repeat protein [Flavobacteriaceae bacterium XHP0103]|uniref:tetratricopeptide repeat protein n=1 Tax=Marixanthotalea marina TaxID=2844359 RepID=UPI0029899EF9|nr:tetratricopeptide repeat protein [Marixanthotalea marina]MBU3822017.1 tetratricopeptide repeat protein [Marixanthotalea marina]
MRRFILIAILFPVISFGQANKLIRQALKSTDYNEQIELFTQAIEADPENLDAYFYRGLAKYGLGEYSSAILDYTKVLFHNPDADSYYNRGNAKFALNDFQGAMEDYNKALEIDPELYDAIYNLGLAKYYLGEYAEAIEEFDKISSAFPTDQKVYTQKALTYMALEQYNEAFKNYASRILLNPDGESFYNRGLALLSVNYYKEAQADFYKAIQLDRENIPAYFFVSVTHLFLGEFTNAVSGFTETLKYDASDFDALLGLAMAQYKANDKASAKTNFQKAKNILGIVEPSPSIESFNETYWHQDQYYYLNGIFKELIAL